MSRNRHSAARRTRRTRVVLPCVRGQPARLLVQPGGVERRAARPGRRRGSLELGRDRLVRAPRSLTCVASARVGRIGGGGERRVDRRELTSPRGADHGLREAAGGRTGRTRRRSRSRPRHAPDRAQRPRPDRRAGGWRGSVPTRRPRAGAPGASAPAGPRSGRPTSPPIVLGTGRAPRVSPTRRA